MALPAASSATTTTHTTADMSTRHRKPKHATTKPNTSKTTQSVAASAPLKRPSRAWDRAWAIPITLMVLLYAPVSSTFFLVGDQISHIGDKYYYEPLVSWDFAYGNGSGHPGSPGDHYAALQRNAAVMMPHSVLGTLAIVLGLFQFLPVFQFKYPVIHRTLGRLYGLCAVAITLSSASFLRDTIPKKDVFSGELFAMILSMLSFANILTMTLAVLMVWGGDVGSHREFMALNYSFMLSAPLLRVGWILLGRFWNETKYTINLYSAVLAGPLLITAPMFYLRHRYPRPANETLMSVKLHLGVLAASVLSLFYIVPLMSNPVMWSYRRTELFWTIVPQFVFQAVTFTWLATTSMNRGDKRANTAWRTYQNGLMAAPIFAGPIFHMLKNTYDCPDEMMGLGVVSGAWTSALAVSYVVYVLSTSKFVNRASAKQAN